MMVLLGSLLWVCGQVNLSGRVGHDAMTRMWCVGLGGPTHTIKKSLHKEETFTASKKVSIAATLKHVAEIAECLGEGGNGRGNLRAWRPRAESLEGCAG